MDICSLNHVVERYLRMDADKTDHPVEETGESVCNDARSFMIMNSARRLVNTYRFYRNNSSIKNDFLCSLRNYLLVGNTSLELPCLAEEEKLDDFGLSIDEEGRVSATFALPEYIIHKEFVEQVFLRNLPEQSGKAKYDLSTSPFIYRLTGFKEYKSVAQQVSVNGTLSAPDGYTVLVSLPTGGGKSLITQAMAYQQMGLTIVVVPTVSLAIDQVRVARNTIRTEHPEEEIFCYYSGSNEKEKIFYNLKQKKIRLLFISPEALIQNPVFVEAIEEANENRYLKSIVIDEAHIVIDWGGLFRVDYQCLAPWRRKLIENNPYIKTALLSATFTEEDVDCLKSLFSTEGKWIEIRCDELRKEPRFMCMKAHSLREKYNWAVEIIRKLPHPMIVYVSNPYEAEQLKKRLVREGFENVKTFTGETGSSERQRLIDEWSDNQFDVMVATSAFGVGVDKPDVRTVMHLYVPETPNAYYQELGRGGRDGLPCLSVMCIFPEYDLHSSKVGKVLTTEKIIGRWLSMLNQDEQLRIGNMIYIDTSVKPSYNVASYRDKEGSAADVNWNIYVLLLLRRYKKISIIEMQKNTGEDRYIFAVSIDDSRIFKSEPDDELVQIIDEIREREASKIYSAYDTIKKAILNSSSACWSEMFYSTYMMVNEYCAGCDEHTYITDSASSGFDLKKPVREPVRMITSEVRALLGRTRECLIYYENDTIVHALDFLIKIGLTNIIISDPDDWKNIGFLEKSDATGNINLIDAKEYKKMAGQNNGFFLSGAVAVIYSEDVKQAYNLLFSIKKHHDLPMATFHFARKDLFMNNLGKNLSEIIDGLILPIERLQ